MWTLTVLGKHSDVHARSQWDPLFMDEKGPVTDGCMPTPKSWCHVALMHIRNDPECSTSIFCPTFAVSPSRQTRRMQAKTSVRNNASVFLNTTSLLHQVKMPKQCSYEFRMRSGIWIYVLEFGIFLISLIFNCQSLSYIHHTLVLFSRSMFSCSHLSVTPIFSSPSFTVPLSTRVSSSYSFSFQFPFSAFLFLPFLPFQMETKSETYFALFINALNGHL